MDARLWIATVVLAALVGCGSGGRNAAPAGDDAGSDGQAAAPLGSTLATVTVRDTSGTSAARSDVPVTFGQPFAPGDVPRGTTVAARIAGQVIPLQVDPKATHADGSLRHAVLTALVPSLPGNGSVTLELFATASQPGGGASPSVSDLLATTFDVTVGADVAGTPYRASARALLSTDASRVWLRGPLVTEWTLSAPLKDAAGVAHPLLDTRFEVRAYAGMKTVFVSAAVENDWAYPPGPQNVTYDASLATDMGPVWSKKGLVHFRQARWRKAFYWGDDPRVAVQHDVAYLMKSGSLPNFDPSVTASEGALANLQMQFAAHSEPMQIGLATAYMPTTGGRGDIGPLPSWASLYVISQDARAKAATLGTGELAGTWQIHYRDQTTDRPVSLVDHPYMTLLGNPGDAVNPKTGRSDAFPACAGTCSSPNTPDSSHQPSLAYVPYLLTGDFYFLEELEFWANWNMLQANPAYRGHEEGLLQWDQARGQAWSMRTLGQAAYIAPDTDPLKTYFVDRVGYNVDWYEKRYSSASPPSPLGYITNGFTVGSDGTIAPWMDDFFSWSVGYLVDLGFDQAKPLRAWKAQYVVGRMTNPGYCWIFASVYHMPVEDPTTKSYFATWSDIYAHTLQAQSLTALQSMPCGGTQMASALHAAPGQMVGYADSAEGYPSNLQPALAVAVESAIPNAAQAWSTFTGRSVKPDYSAEPQFAIVPRP